MARRYVSYPIPPRAKPTRGRRPERSPSKTWNMISQEELFLGTGAWEEEVPIPEPVQRLWEQTRVIPFDRETRAQAFLEQAREMEDYEDDLRLAGKVPHTRYVGYWDLTPRELRRYFAWRTLFRGGQKVGRNETFAQICAAELLNGIGAKTPKEIFDGLLKLQAAGSGRREFLRDWIRDFVIISGFASECAQAYCVYHPEREMEKLVLQDCAEADDASLYQVVRALLDDPIRKSRFLSEHRPDAECVIARVMRNWPAPVPAQDAAAVTCTDDADDTPGLLRELFGGRRSLPAELFTNCPFVCTAEEGYRYVINAVQAYTYTGGKWYRESISSLCSAEGLRHLKAVVRECDRLMRMHLGAKSHLAQKLDEPDMTRRIAAVIHAFYEEKRRAALPQVEVDLSRLSAIRSDAAVTREQLLEGTEEEMEEGPEFLPPPAGMDIPARTDRGDEEPASRRGSADNRQNVTAAEVSATSPFTFAECAFLRCLLDGRPWQDVVRDMHVPVSVAADGINEKMWEELGDSVIEMDGEMPVLVEDYREDLEAML